MLFSYQMEKRTEVPITVTQKHSMEEITNFVKKQLNTVRLYAIIGRDVFFLVLRIIIWIVLLPIFRILRNLILTVISYAFDLLRVKILVIGFVTLLIVVGTMDTSEMLSRQDLEKRSLLSSKTNWVMMNST